MKRRWITGVALLLGLGWAGGLLAAGDRRYRARVEADSPAAATTATVGA